NKLDEVIRTLLQEFDQFGPNARVPICDPEVKEACESDEANEPGSHEPEVNLDEILNAYYELETCELQPEQVPETEVDIDSKIMEEFETVTNDPVVNEPNINEDFNNDPRITENDQPCKESPDNKLTEATESQPLELTALKDLPCKSIDES